MKHPPVLGVDLDNTIICYDQAFHRAAVERSWIAAKTPVTKKAVKSAVLESQGDARWTELQGFVYGPGISAARAFPGVVDFFQACFQSGQRVAIISHKTRYAAAGPRYDLREAAKEWLGRSGLMMKGIEVIFADTRAEKIERVRELACGMLIDDLPEVFREPGYPVGAEFILFDPANEHAEWTETRRVASWAEAMEIVCP